MAERIAAAASRPNARTIGVVYLLYFLTVILAALLTKGLVVPGNAAATANNVLAHEFLYRAGHALDFIANAIYIALTALFFILFEHVNRRVSLIAAFIGLVGCAVQIFGSLFQLVPLIVQEDNLSLSAFKTEQLQATALLSVKLYAQTFNITLVLFGFYDFLIGYLIVRSTFIPRALGVLMMIAGMGWLTYVWPPLATSLSWGVQPLGFLAEFLFMLWLLHGGVRLDEARAAPNAPQSDDTCELDQDRISTSTGA